MKRGKKGISLEEIKVERGKEWKKKERDLHLNDLVTGRLQSAENSLILE